MTISLFAYSLKCRDRLLEEKELLFACLHLLANTAQLRILSIEGTLRLVTIGT